MLTQEENGEAHVSRREIAFFEPRLIEPGRWQTIQFVVRVNRRRFALGFDHSIALPQGEVMRRIKHGLLLPVRTRDAVIPEDVPVWLVRDSENSSLYQVLLAPNGPMRVGTKIVLWKGTLPNNRLYARMHPEAKGGSISIRHFLRQQWVASRTAFRPQRRFVQMGPTAYDRAIAAAAMARKATK